VRAAEALRREGFAGSLTLVGAETHWPPFDRPPLSKQVLAGTWPEDKARLRVAEGLDATLLLGRQAVALDPAGRVVTLDDGSSLAYDGLVIATGATPRSLPGAVTLRSIDDARALALSLSLSLLTPGSRRGRRDPGVKTRLGVIGAGFIGCEVAATARGLGCEVTLVEALAWPLVTVLGEEMGRVVAALHQRNGVDVRLGAGLVAPSELDADVVVAGIGVTPNTGWLEGSGVVIDDGVVCDASLAVAGVDDVVAVGDVARWPNQRFGHAMRIEHWTNAAEQADHAARTLLHHSTDPFVPIPYFWSHQYDTRFQFVGTGRPADDIAVVEGTIEEGRFVATYTREGVVVGALCVNRPNRTIHWQNEIAAATGT
jgi:NADPH-dependent 2,4-dienoyl-CoA reductase/sulfur reductase-like enzyme